MSLVPAIATTVPLPSADARLVDRAALQRELSGLGSEVRFDEVSRALYSTDASVYQIKPLGVVVVKSRDDLIEAVRICSRLRCPFTLRGGGTSQAGQAIGEGLIIDTSKYLSNILELNAAERWVRVEPGIVLDELNAALKPHGLRFAPDISTASRATVGGMMANNSAGARSVMYGKTIDHVLEQTVLLSDGSIVHLRPLEAGELDEICRGTTLEAECYRGVRNLAREHAAEVELRYPKVLRRVMGYNLDEFTQPQRPFNMTKMMVGSEGTLGVILEAKLNLVPLPKAKAVLTIQFGDLLDALEATPIILKHHPSAVEVMDGFILDHTAQNAALQRIRETFVQGRPGALLCVEMYDEADHLLPPRLQSLEQDLRARGFGDHFYHALSLTDQGRVWSLREAALGLSMAMKDDAKSLSFVEDTAVPPEKLRDYIDRFLRIIRKHGTTAGVYAHASVGCLHVRPVVNMKTEDGVGKFEAIANDISELVLEFGGALSGEHGDGLVRSPFIRKMFGPVLYEAFRTIKRAFDPHGILNPGKIVDAPPIASNLRYGAGYKTAAPATWFDYSDYGGMGGAVEMCSGLGACRKKLEGTMCPSYMATREEAHSTRGRANVLRLAMTGKLGESGLGDQGVYDVLDLCLECRACKAECPVGVDMARFKSEFLADYWSRHGTPMHARVLGNARQMAAWGNRFAGLANALTASHPARWLNGKLFGIDARRSLPAWSPRSLDQLAARPATGDVLLFADTFTNYYDPHIGMAALQVLDAIGTRAGLISGACCGRPLISKGLLREATEQAERTTATLYEHAKRGAKLVFCEPSCLSSIREDLPSLLRGESQSRAKLVAESSLLFEEALQEIALPLQPRPGKLLLHGHCHQKSMGLLNSTKNVLARIPQATVVDLDAGCCGMAGSFGYTHFDVSSAIAQRKLLPAIQQKLPEDLVIAPGTSCRHQVHDLAGVEAIHPAVLLASLLESRA